MERRIDVYKKEAETARKWSSSLANLNHTKATNNNTTSTSLTRDNVMHEDQSPNSSPPPIEIVEIPVTVTKENVTICWKVLSHVVDAIAFVLYRPICNSSQDVDEGTGTSLGSMDCPTAVYLQSEISLQPNDYSEIEVKAQHPGLYVLQLKATK